MDVKVVPSFKLKKDRFTYWAEMGQSCEEEVLVWVFPNHESKTSDLEKPILALPIHRIDIPEKLKKWHQEVEKLALGG